MLGTMSISQAISMFGTPVANNSKSKHKSHTPISSPAPTTKPIIKYDASYNIIKTQNLSLQNAINGYNENTSLEQNQLVYKSDQISILKYVLYSFIALYVIAFIIFAVIMVTSKKINWTIKFPLILLFLGYPYLIYSIENGFFKMIYFVYSVLNGESYYNITNTKSIQNKNNFSDINNMITVVKNDINLLDINKIENLLQNIIQNLINDYQNKMQGILTNSNNEIVLLQEDANNCIIIIQYNISDLSCFIVKIIQNFQSDLKNTTQDIFNIQITLIKNIQDRILQWEDIYNNYNAIPITNPIINWDDLYSKYESSNDPSMTTLITYYEEFLNYKLQLLISIYETTKNNITQNLFVIYLLFAMKTTILAIKMVIDIIGQVKQIVQKFELADNTFQKQIIINFLQPLLYKILDVFAKWIEIYTNCAQNQKPNLQTILDITNQIQDEITLNFELVIWTIQQFVEQIIKQYISLYIEQKIYDLKKHLDSVSNNLSNTDQHQLIRNINKFQQDFLSKMVGVPFNGRQFSTPASAPASAPSGGGRRRHK